MVIDEGLRVLLERFTLPGEAQQVDRIMQVFGSKYLTDNPESFMTATGAYALSYAIMMLQTSLYNQQVRENERMKLEDFV